MTTDFSETYRHKSSDELLRLAREKDSLQDSARQALDAEMKKRGLGEAAAARFEEQEHEENERAAQSTIVQKQTKGNWMGSLVIRFLVFGGSGTLTVVIADYILKPPSEAVRLLTKMSLDAALALAVLAGVLPSRWITFKRIVVSAVIFSFALFGFMVWSVATARRH